MMNCVHTHFDSLFHYEGRFGHIQSSLTQPLFTEVPVSSQESKRSYICVLAVSILHLSTILRLKYGTVLTL